MSKPTTVDRILDAAEVLFSEHGFAETSLRSITSSAGVNLAAVNYHFGSKKALIQAVFTRYLDPFMAELDEAVSDINAQNSMPDLEEVLELLVEQILAVKPRRANDISIFMRLIGLAYIQNQGHLKRYLKENYGTVLQKYFQLIHQCCPTLPVADMYWRTYFILGSAVFTMSGADALLAIARRDHNIEDNIESIMRRMVPFMASGLRAHTDAKTSSTLK